MAKYKGYEYTIEYDEDKPLHLNWRFSIYQQSKIDPVRRHVDYAATRGDAERTAKQYIDMWVKQDGHSEAKSEE